MLATLAFGPIEILAQAENTSEIDLLKTQFSEQDYLSDTHNVRLSFLSNQENNASVESRSVIEHFLDSIHYSNGTKYYMLYNENGDVEKFQSTKNEALKYQGLFAYDESNLLIELVNTSYDDVTLVVDYQSIYQYAYDGNMNLVEYTSTSLDENGEEGSQFIERFHYSTNGQLEYHDVFSIFDGEEYLIRKSLYTYDANNRLEEIERFTSDFTGDLEPWHNSIYTYGTNGKIESHAWGRDWTKIYEYDANDILKTRYHEFHGSNPSVSKTDYYYDSDYSTGEKLNYYYFIYSNPDFFPATPSEKISFKNSYAIDEDGTAIDETFLTEYFWSTNNLETSLSSNEIKQVDFFPNPVSDKLTLLGLELEGELNLEIYDLLGRLVKSEKVSSEEQVVDVAYLSTGSFFFTLSKAENVFYSGRFIKE